MWCEKININNLITLCSKVSYEDSYSCSPVYYLMTGRKGGWIIKKGALSFITMLHPNMEQCMLIFPAFRENGNSIDLSEEKELAEILLKENPLLESVRIARVPESLVESCSDIIIDEDLLDWRYPIRILDVDGILSLKGKGYAQVRQRLNRFQIEHCTIHKIETFSDYNIVLNMVREWIREFPYTEYSEADLLQPTRTLLNLMNNEKLKISGQIIRYDERPVSYCIWEEKSDIANAYAMSAERKIPGLAEYNIVTMCRQLAKKGIKKVNIGGSETEGLNRYKKKFSPIQSIPLYTCEIRR